MRVLSGLLLGLVLAATPADSTDAAPADTTTTPDLSCVFDHFFQGTEGPPPIIVRNQRRQICLVCLATFFREQKAPPR